jgi:Integrase core domain
LHKPIIRKFKRRKVVVHGIDQIWSADLVDMRHFANHNKGFKYLLTVIDIFSKYAWAVPLKTKTGQEQIQSFQKLMKERKPTKLWTDAGREFINKEFKKFLTDNKIELYQTYNEGKAVVIERFNRTLKEKMWRYFTETNSNKYLDVLPKLVAEYNNTIHSTIKMTPIKGSLKENEHKINYFTKITKEKPKFKIGNRVRIYKHKKLFHKGYETNWTNEIFVISAINKTSPITYKIKDLNGEDILGSFYKQELNLSSL